MRRRLIQISDPHLSRQHAFFQANFRHAVAHAAAAAPDLVVSSGDLSLEGAERPDDLVFAAAEHARITVPLRVLAGNHDVGEEAPGRDGKPVVDDVRLATFRRHFGADRWSLELGAWRIVGVNAMLCGSGLAAERWQEAWLAERLATDRPVGLFLHKPLYADAADEPAMPGATVPPEARWRLLDLLASSTVRFVACGHLHQHRHLRWREVDLLWAPAISFMISPPWPDADPRPGYLEFTFDGPDYACALRQPPTLAPIDIAALKGHGRYPRLVDMPPFPPTED